MFARRQGSDDVYDTIPNLAANFGLAGMETNTILIGWPRRPEANARYGHMIGRLVELDLSVLMLRLDPERGFGKQQRIDIWWDGVASTGQLMLTLAYLLTSDAGWKSARVRVLVTGRPGADQSAAQKRLNRIIGQARVQAEAQLLAPLASDLADRIRQESAHADLVMIHALAGDDASLFVAANQPLLKGLGTALLVRPSRVFDDPFTVFPKGEADHPSMEIVPRPLTVRAPPSPALAPTLERLERRIRDAYERFLQNVYGPSVDEERSFVADVVHEVEDLRQVERRLARRGGRVDTARGLVEWVRNRYATALLNRSQVFVSAASRGRDDSADLGWTRRLREGVTSLLRDIETAVQEIPTTIAVPTSEDDWASATSDGFRLRWKKIRVRWAMRWLRRPPPARKVAARRVALRHMGPSLWSGLTKIVDLEGVRRLDALNKIRRLTTDVDRCFGNLTIELDRLNDTGSLMEFQESVAREVAGLADGAAGAAQRFGQSDAQSQVTLEAMLADATQAFADDLGRRDIEQLARRWPATVPETAARRAVAAVEAAPGRWGDQVSATISALDLDLQVAALTVSTRRALYQLEARVRREVEQGPLNALETAARIMRDIAEAGTDDVGTKDVAPVDPPSGSGASSPASPAASDTVDYIAAADELRATWEAPYRPVSQNLLDQLVGALGRAAERMPRTVSTMPESALAAALEGQSSATQANYPARRLLQTFLDQRVLQPTRIMVSGLPPLVEDAQEVLFDAVRLVAFELEQAAGEANADGGFEDDPADQNALTSVIDARVERLDVAARELRAYVERFRSAVFDDWVPALNGARAAAVGSPGRSDSTTPRAIAGPGLAHRLKTAVETAEGRMSTAARWMVRGPTRVTSAKARPSAGDLIDDLAALREGLQPNADQQAELPLLYRRIFGRAALEKSDLLRGRDDEVARLGRAVSRWVGGAAGPIAIIGQPRSGRTSLAGLVARELLQDRTIVRAQPGAGGADDVESVNAAIVSAVGGREGQGAEGALRAMPPGAVVVLDELGRWLSRSPGGLDGLRLWQRLWRRLGDRHLFVVVATPYTWRYASRLLSLEQGFLGIAECGAVEPEAIRELLLLRQRTADFELEFARVRWGPLRWPDAINEGRQMKRLYERSRGNVGEALDLWRRSVVAATERRITVYVAPEPDLSALDRLPLRWRVALTAVAFHRAVSAARLALMLRSSREEATALLADLERAQLVAPERSGAWGLDPVMQPHILPLLRTTGGLG